MATNTVTSDKGIGFAVLFSLLALLGAAAMALAPGQMGKAWGFALAMTAAGTAVAVTHAYGV